MINNDVNSNHLKSIQYQRMIEEVQDYAILLLNLEGNIQNWNKGAEKIKGYKENEILGKNFSLFYLPEDRKLRVPDTLINLAVTTGRATHEGWRVRKDGTTFWGYVVITALHDDEGNVIGFTKVTRDLTERKLAEEEKERDTRNIEIQNRQLEEFAYITSHDLQEPIRKIQTFINLARRDLDNKEALNIYLEKMNTSANKMVGLIKDVLNFSRLSQDKNEFSSVNLNTVLEEVFYDLELLIEEKNATITVEPLPVVSAISVQMHQLFSNLINNAIKFSPLNPAITIKYEKTKGTLEDLDSLLEYHLITLSDKGIGFDQKYADLAFQPFKRINTEYNGTGIGLALCKRIIENHRGKITVTSAPGEGTTFFIALPIT